MSSNGLWTTMENYHPLHSLHFPRDNAAQDEPLDFSQKSDSSEKDTTSPKTEEVQKNGHLADILSRGGYTSLEHLYLVRNASDLQIKRSSEQHSPSIHRTPDSLSRSVNSSPTTMVTAACQNRSRASPARSVNYSPVPLSAVYSHSRPAVVVSPPSSHASDLSSKSPDGKTSPLLSSPECKERLPNFGTVFPANGKGQKRFLEEEQSDNGEKRIPSPQETAEGHIRQSNKYNGSPSPNPVPQSAELLAMQQPALAQLLLSGRSTCQSSVPIDTKPVDTKLTKSVPHELPRVSITSPMMVRKANGSSPMQPNPLHSALMANSVPFQAGFSPPVVVEDPSKITSSLVPMPNPWEVYPTQSYDDKKSRTDRPFKKFGNEILSSCKPEVLASMVGVGGGRSAAFDKYIKFRSEYMDGRQDTADSTRAITSPESVHRSNQDSNDSEVGDSQQEQLRINQRRSGTKFPDQHKDPAYWERRRKNNEAAKRSRDARRRKEDALAMTAKELLEDKMRMTMHLSFQMKEMRKLEEENRFLKEREVALQNCLFHLERRCRECSKCSTGLLGDAEDSGRKQHCNTN
ncbi:hypothetical protein JTE90_014835 [Oedothorax gibbosus]|uniref:BZIP domain-containing protein n=1 Tax=Oedothorax gibbosus TaxID=931172 RepID=A0AAV6TVR9_9ARAC|nr:hypothetical protein JTE90_014835 [Oedothorax gibbosus]